MGLLDSPRTRNTTYGSGDPVLSVDLIDIEDALIADWEDLHGVKRLSIPIGSHNATYEQGSPGAISFACPVATCVPSTILDTAHGSFGIPLPFKPGDRVLSLRIAYGASAVGAPTPHLRYLTDGFHIPLGIGTTWDAAFGTVLDDAGAIKIQQWTVDTPVALGIRNPNPGTPDPLRWAQSARLSLEAGVDNTTFYAVDFLYDVQPVVEVG